MKAAAKGAWLAGCGPACRAQQSSPHAGCSGSPLCLPAQVCTQPRRLASAQLPPPWARLMACSDSSISASNKQVRRTRRMRWLLARVRVGRNVLGCRACSCVRYDPARWRGFRAGCWRGRLAAAPRPPSVARCHTKRCWSAFAQRAVSWPRSFYGADASVWRVARIRRSRIRGCVEATCKTLAVSVSRPSPFRTAQAA
jgi:hypothetical protein